MVNVLLFLIITAAVASAAGYLIRARKKGRACIGCPYGASGGTGCHCCGKDMSLQQKE